MAVRKYHGGPVNFIFLMLTVYILYTVEGVLVDVRLDNGTTPNEGTVWYTEDCQNWYRTCGSGLGIKDVIIICRHLGFSGANRALMNSPFGGPFGNQPQTTIDCGEEEGDITTCTLTAGCPSDGSTAGAVCYGSNYLGCYKDVSTSRVLNDQQNVNIGGLTIDKCFEFCQSYSGMVFAGLELGNECYCGGSSSNYSKHGPVSSDSLCHDPCDGDQYQSCGGVGYIAIFNLTPDPPLSPNPMDSPCSMTTPPISTTSSTVTESTVPTTTSQETSGLSNEGEENITTCTLEPGCDSTGGAVCYAPYAAIGGGIAAAVVVCIIVFFLVCRCKSNPKQDPQSGLGPEEMTGGQAASLGYEDTVVAAPEASDSDTWRMNMKDDQEGELEKDAFTAQMRRRPIPVEYVNMKNRDNPEVMEPEYSFNNLANDAAGKNAVTSTEAEYFNVLSNPKQDLQSGLGPEEMTGGLATSLGYEDTVVAVPEASGNRSLWK